MARERATRAAARPTAFQEYPVIDVVFVALTIALFALVALVAKGVEKL